MAQPTRATTWRPTTIWFANRWGRCRKYDDIDVGELAALGFKLEDETHLLFRDDVAVATRPGCCARATSGHAAAAPPGKRDELRRFIRSPRPRGRRARAGR